MLIGSDLPSVVTPPSSALEPDLAVEVGAQHQDSNNSQGESQSAGQRPMAPARSSGRRARSKRKAQNAQRQEPVVESDVDEQQPQVEQLFLDPMSGLPLQLYIEKDVENRDVLVESVIVRRTCTSSSCICRRLFGLIWIHVLPSLRSMAALSPQDTVAFFMFWVCTCLLIESPIFLCIDFISVPRLSSKFEIVITLSGCASDHMPCFTKPLCSL